MHPPLYKSYPLIPTLFLNRRRPQHTNAVAPSLPFTQNLASPFKHLPRPAASHHDTTNDVDQPDYQSPEAPPLLYYSQHNRFNIEFNEDAWYVGFRDLVGLGGDGVLVSLDSVCGVEHVRC